MVDQLVGELRSYARQHSLSSGKLVKMLGVHPDTVKKWLTKGKTHEEPSPKSAMKIRSLLSAKEGNSIRNYAHMFSELEATSGLVEQQMKELSEKGVRGK